MPKTQPPALVIVAGDTHSGSYVGLIHPQGVRLDKAGLYTPSPLQRWLWDSWLDFIRTAKVLALRRRVYLVLNGDLVDGAPHGSIENITPSMKLQREIARQALTPLTEIADRLFVVRGTPAHVGQLGENEDELAQHFRAEQAFDGAWTWQHLQFEAAGVLVDAMHHPRGGSGPNAARALAQDTILDRTDHGERVPALVLRSHVHIYRDSRDEFRTCRAVLLPAWQATTEYGYKLGGRRAVIGGLLACAEAGRLDSVEVKRYDPPKVRPWRDRAA